MEPTPRDRRQQDRAYAEPYTTNAFLEFALSGRVHSCLLLDVSPHGLGMLVSHTEKEMLQHLRPGARMSMVKSLQKAPVAKP